MDETKHFLDINGERWIVQTETDSRNSLSEFTNSEIIRTQSEFVKIENTEEKCLLEFMNTNFQSEFIKRETSEISSQLQSIKSETIVDSSEPEFVTSKINETKCDEVTSSSEFIQCDETCSYTKYIQIEPNQNTYIDQQMELRNSEKECFVNMKNESMKTETREANAEFVKLENVVKTGRLLSYCGKKNNACGKYFAQTSSIKYHKLIHSGVKPHICLECGKCFTRGTDLKKHKRTHSGEKPYACDECGKSFTHSSSLRNHKLIHSGEKTHACSECGKCYTRGPALKKHKLIHHSGEKQYKWHNCSNYFTQPCALKDKKIIHSGE